MSTPAIIHPVRADYLDDDAAYISLRSAKQFRHCWVMAQLHECPKRHRAYLRARMREEALYATDAARSHARRRRQNAA